MTNFDLDFIKSEESLKIDADTFSEKCRCCLSRNALVSMTEPIEYEGSTQTYYGMLFSCFSVELPGCNSDYLICNCCILRLKFGFSFKNEVLSAQKRIKNEKYANIEDTEADNCGQSQNDSSDEDNIPISVTLQIKKKCYKDSYKEVSNEKESKSHVDRLDSNKEFEHQKIKRIRIKDLSKEESAKRRQSLAIKKKEKLVPYKLDKSSRSCPICKEEFTLHKNLITHMNIHYPHFLCSHCGKGYATEKQLHSHLISHDILISCKICKKEVKKTSLHRHIKTHSGEIYVYRCPTCSERFKSFYQRTTHMAKFHDGEMPSYKCKLCPKQYAMSGSLSQHVRKEHLNVRKYCCSECSKCFFAKTDLTYHMRIHTGERLVCNICSEGFLRPSKLNAHMKVHIGGK